VRRCAAEAVCGVLTRPEPSMCAHAVHDRRREGRVHHLAREGEGVCVEGQKGKGGGGGGGGAYECLLLTNVCCLRAKKQQKSQVQSRGGPRPRNGHECMGQWSSFD